SRPQSGARRAVMPGVMPRLMPDQSAISAASCMPSDAKYSGSSGIASVKPAKPMKQAAAIAKRLRVTCGLRAVGLRLAGRQLAPRRPILAVPEQVVGLHERVDLARAFVDHGALAVAVEAADRILVGIAVGTVNLHGVGGGALRRDGR